MRVLVFQHVAAEHPGVFRDFMAADGVAWDPVILDQGAPIPALDGYDAILVMGGPQNVWQEDEHPWLVDEKEAIREAVARGIPFLGVCLGHQLLADALGGEVVLMAAPKVAVMDVEVTGDGAADPLFGGFGGTVRCVNWHEAEISRLPPGGRLLARAPGCEVQAMAVGPAAYGLQYHLEIAEGTVPEWTAMPEYERSLHETLGPDGASRFKAEITANLARLNAGARLVYDGFMDLVRARRRSSDI